MQHPRLSRRSVIRLMGSTAVAAAVLPGLGLPAMAAEPKKGGTLTYVLSGEPQALVALTNTSGVNVHVSAKVTEGLLAYDFDVKPQPSLATAWEVLNEGRSIIFTLREGVKWHDGQDFTAEDVAFSLTTLKEVHPRMRGALADLEEVVVLEPHKVELKLARPAPHLFRALAAQEAPMIPRHIYEGSEVATNPANAAPIGTGPYRFKEWVSGSHVVLVRNDDYWDAGKPFVDQLIFRVIKDAASAAVAMETGEGDIVDAVGLSLTDVERLEKLPNLGTTTDGWAYAPTVLLAEFNFDNPVLANHKVRQAIAHAVNLEDLIEVAWYGRANIVTGPIPPDFPDLYANMPVHAYDPQLSAKLLDEAGYPVGANGKRFKVMIDAVPYGTGPRRSAVVLQQALEDVGIEVELRDQDFASYTKRVYTDRAFDICINSISTGADPMLGLYRIFHTSQFKVGVPFSNGAHYSNPAVDAALDSARVETDEGERAGFFKEFARLVHEDLPSLTLASQIKTTIYNARVQDHTLGADGIRSSLASVWLDV